MTGLGRFKPCAGLGLNATNFRDVQFAFAAPAVGAAFSPNAKRVSYGAAALLRF